MSMALTVNHIQKFWCDNTHNPLEMEGFLLCDYMVCNDGFMMSIQASAFHYCHPRELLPDGSYTHWEIAHGKDDLLLSEYSDGSIAAYVPTHIVNRVIENHGGVAVNSIPLLRRGNRNA